MWWARLATVATVGRRRGEAFQARGAIRRSRKAYNCCPGPGWPLWRHCWTKTGPAEARRSLSSPRCHPLLSESIELLSWAWLATVAPLLDEDWAGWGAARPFKPEVPSVAFGKHCWAGWGAARVFKPEVPSVAFGSHITAVLGLAGHGGAIAGRRQVRLRRGDACQARGAIRGFRNPHNCCPGWPLGAIAGWTLGRLRRGEAFQARGAIRRFRKALLGRLRRGEAFQARGAIRRFRNPYNCCLGLGWPQRRHCWTKTGPAEARRGFSSPRCHPSLSEAI